MKFYGMSNQIGMDAGCVLEGTISLNTISDLGWVWNEPKPMNNWKCSGDI